MPAKQIVDYRVVMTGAEIGGHPVTRITKSLQDACEMVDLFRKNFPNNEIIMYQTVEEEKMKFTPLRPPAVAPVCLHGHTGFVDGRSIIVQTGNGYYCTTCGDFFNAPSV